MYRQHPRAGRPAGAVRQSERGAGRHGHLPIGGIRSRAHWLDTWQMADGKHDYAFVHMTLKIGAGRSLESREAVGEMLFALIKTHFRGADGEPLSGAVVRARRAAPDAQLQTKQRARVV
jgi:5-carboxymethyl-2-hydroxymuconate isomerase